MKQQKSDATGAKVDMKLEVDIIPVSDVERSKLFWRIRVEANRSASCETYL
jgi:hypothetical protein